MLSIEVEYDKQHTGTLALKDFLNEGGDYEADDENSSVKLGGPYRKRRSSLRCSMQYKCKRRRSSE